MSSILVTGGTGTFGRAFVRDACAHDRWDRVVVFSRDEVKQAQLYADAEGWVGGGKLRLFLGDVRDFRRLQMAFRGVQAVVHAAALKRVDAGAYSPGELIDTNIVGTRNVVDAAIEAGVAYVVVISSDKAVQATNIYGVTKAAAEFYAVQANAYARIDELHRRLTRISAVRYGNVLGSRGSVFHIWKQQAINGGPLTLTDVEMTRFIMTIEQAVALVNRALSDMAGGEVFVPMLPSARMDVLAEAVVRLCAPLLPAFRDGEGTEWLVETGARPGGEKLSEQLLSEEEPTRTLMRPTSGIYVVLPTHHDWTKGAEWQGYGDPVPPSFSYRSDSETNRWLTADDLLALMRETEACR